MSRHFFKTEYQGKPITVLMGFDRPMGGYFMVIEEDDQKDDDYIFTNLYEQITHPKTIKPYRDKLKQLGIFVPVEMLMAIETDDTALMGNKDVYHSISNGTHQSHEYGFSERMALNIRLDS